MLTVPRLHNRLIQPGGCLYFFFCELVACIWHMIYPLLAMVSEGRTLAAFPTFLEAGVVALEVLDVSSQFFDHGDEALVVICKLGILGY